MKYTATLSLVVLFPTLVSANTPNLAGDASATFRAVRAGDLATVKSLLGGGSDIDARLDDGSTLLMAAVVGADLEMVRFLLEVGADVNAENQRGARALTRALHDREKVEALIEGGAEIDFRTGKARDGFTPLLFAAGYPGRADIVRLLVDNGANVNAERQGFSVVTNASLRGDYEIVQLLVEHGARVNASGDYQPIHGAATKGPPAMVRLLLANGAKADVQVLGLSPVAYASAYGHPMSVRLLIEAGADVNARSERLGITPLLWSAGMGDPEVVHMLLEAGADINAVDRAGNTPLYWALRRGDEKTAAMLRRAGAREPVGESEAPTESFVKGQIDEEKIDARAIRRIVATSLPLIQLSSESFSESRACFSCHHQSLAAMTVALGRTRGFKVREDIAKSQIEVTRRAFGSTRELLMNGLGATDEPAPAFALIGFDAEGQEPDRLTDALVQYLVVRQEAEGHWHTLGVRPPHDYSDFTYTALAVRALESYGSPGRGSELRAAVSRARGWLTRAEPRDTEDRAFQLLGLAWSKADQDVVNRRGRELLAKQRKDGGWSQIDTLACDAYATGLALYSLHVGGGVPVNHEAYRKGIRYLITTHLADGSWFVRKRAFPLQRYFDAGFPHERNQFISMAATCWATMALLLSCDTVSGR